MVCPHCHSPLTSRLNRPAHLRYPVFRCRTGRGQFNERTGAPFHSPELPTDIVFPVLFCPFASPPPPTSAIDFSSSWAATIHPENARSKRPLLRRHSLLETAATISNQSLMPVPPVLTLSASRAERKT